MPTTDTIYIRSIEMNCMNQALARDRMRQAEHRARHASLAREVAATRRWRRVGTFARAAEKRHAARVGQVSAAR